MVDKASGAPGIMGVLVGPEAPLVSSLALLLPQNKAVTQQKGYKEGNRNGNDKYKSGFLGNANGSNQSGIGGSLKPADVISTTVKRRVN